MKVKFKTGDVINPSLIVKRFRQCSTGHVLVELKKNPQKLIRVDAEYRFLSVKNLQDCPPGDLELLVDREPTDPEILPKNNKSSQCPEFLRPYLKHAFMLKDSEGVHFYDPHLYLIGTLPHAESPKIDKPISELKPGDVLPVASRELCQPESQGFTLKEKGKVILMNSLYIIQDILEFENSRSIEPSEMKAEDFQVEKLILEPKPLVSQAETFTPVSDPEIVHLLADKFHAAMGEYHISADYFVLKKLSQENRPVLQAVLAGDLSKLNEETREVASKLGVIEGGFGLLKAALIHELYINSTLAGRSRGEEDISDSGRNMKNLLTFMVRIQPNGTLLEDHRVLTKKQQKRFIRLLTVATEHYPDKKDVISRIYTKLLFDLKKDVLTPQPCDSELDRFKATFIYKLYENTNRLDRGNGITLICLSRELMEHQFSFTAPDPNEETADHPQAETDSWGIV